jgi:hypothetical protein
MLTQSLRPADWADTPADSNRLVLFSERRNLVSARGSSGSARAIPPGKTRCPLYRRLGGPQGRSGLVRKISVLPGFDPRIIQPVACRFFSNMCTDTILYLIKTKFPYLLFPLINLTFVNTYCCALVQTSSKLHDHEFLWFWKKCQSASDKLLAAVYKFTVTCSSHI